MDSYQIYPAYPNLVCLWVFANDQGWKCITFNRHKALIGRILSTEHINVGAFKIVVARAWSKHAPNKLIFLGQHHFLFVFNTFADKQSVLKQCPWWFMKSHLLLQDCPQMGYLKDIDFSLSMFRVQVHNIPNEMRKDDNFLQRLVNRRGQIFPKLHEVEVGDYATKAWNGFIRLVVDINITLPLVKGFLLKSPDMNLMWIEFMYERMPFFCKICGLVGHMKDECPYRRISHVENFGPELQAVPVRAPSRLSDWMKVDSLIRRQANYAHPAESCHAAGVPHWTGDQKTYIIDISCGDDDTLSTPQEIQLPHDVVSSFSSLKSKGWYLTEHSANHQLGEFATPTLPPFPILPSWPDHPTDAEVDYFIKHEMSEEEYADYKATLAWVQEDADDDDQQRHIRKLYLDFEFYYKFKFDELNEGHKLWLVAAREYCKVHLQRWAYPLKTSVWDITMVGQFSRKELMDALFKDDAEEATTF